MILFILNLARKTLQLELNIFTKNLTCKDITKQAFSKARMNLNPIIFKFFNDTFVSEFYTDNDFKTLYGYRILAVDGSRIQLPSSEALVLELGIINHENICCLYFN
jgi:hypothetical protein